MSEERVIDQCPACGRQSRALTPDELMAAYELRVRDRFGDTRIVAALIEQMRVVRRWGCWVKSQPLAQTKFTPRYCPEHEGGPEIRVAEALPGAAARKEVRAED